MLYTVSSSWRSNNNNTSSIFVYNLGHTICSKWGGVKILVSRRAPARPAGRPVAVRRRCRLVGDSSRGAVRVTMRVTVPAQRRCRCRCLAGTTGWAGVSRVVGPAAERRSAGPVIALGRTQSDTHAATRVRQVRSTRRLRTGRNGVLALPDRIGDALAVPTSPLRSLPQQLHIIPYKAAAQQRASAPSLPNRA